MDVVLVHPCIPQNTGSIARTCAAMELTLHLIEPLGFEISEKRVRRAGLDYWPYVQLQRYESWDSFLSEHESRRLWLFSRFAKRSYHKVSYDSEDMLVFGSETKGLPDEIKSCVSEEQHLLIPMRSKGVRSLNLSNAVSIALYEGLRQCSLLDIPLLDT